MSEIKKIGYNKFYVKDVEQEKIYFKDTLVNRLYVNDINVYAYPSYLMDNYFKISDLSWTSNVRECSLSVYSPSGENISILGKLHKTDTTWNKITDISNWGNENDENWYGRVTFNNTPSYSTFYSYIRVNQTVKGSIYSRYLDLSSPSTSSVDSEAYINNAYYDYVSEDLYIPLHFSNNRKKKLKIYYGNSSTSTWVLLNEEETNYMGDITYDYTVKASEIRNFKSNLCVKVILEPEDTIFYNSNEITGNVNLIYSDIPDNAFSIQTADLRYTEINAEYNKFTMTTYLTNVNLVGEHYIDIKVDNQSSFPYNIELNQTKIEGDLDYYAGSFTVSVTLHLEGYNTKTITKTFLSTDYIITKELNLYDLGWVTSTDRKMNVKLKHYAGSSEYANPKVYVQYWDTDANNWMNFTSSDITHSKVNVSGIITDTLGGFSNGTQGPNAFYPYIRVGINYPSLENYKNYIYYTSSLITPMRSLSINSVSGSYSYSTKMLRVNFSIYGYETYSTTSSYTYGTFAKVYAINSVGNEVYIGEKMIQEGYTSGFSITAESSNVSGGTIRVQLYDNYDYTLKDSTPTSSGSISYTVSNPSVTNCSFIPSHENRSSWAESTGFIVDSGSFSCNVTNPNKVAGEVVFSISSSSSTLNTITSVIDANSSLSLSQSVSGLSEGSYYFDVKLLFDNSYYSSEVSQYLNLTKSEYLTVESEETVVYNNNRKTGVGSVTVDLSGQTVSASTLYCYLYVQQYDGNSWNWHYCGVWNVATTKTKTFSSVGVNLGNLSRCQLIFVESGKLAVGVESMCKLNTTLSTGGGSGGNILV